MNKEELQKKLYQYQDIKYRDFHLSLKGASKMIGVRVPILRKIAKELSNSEYNWFLNEEYDYYEEKAILAYLIGDMKLDFSRILEILSLKIDYFDSWALTDGLCCSLKIFKKNLSEGLILIKKIIHDDNFWHIRIGLVLLLNYYVNDEYIDEVLMIARNVNNNEYYVKMAKAWLLSVCYINYPEKVMEVIKNLDLETKRMTIQKINDSYRIPNKINSI